MIQQTETYYCDRCGKEMDKPCYTKVDVKIKRFRRKRFDEWWKGGEA